MKPPSLSTITAHVRTIAKAGLLVAKEGKVNEKRLEILERESETLKGRVKELEAECLNRRAHHHAGDPVSDLGPSSSIMRDKTDKGENDA